MSDYAFEGPKWSSSTVSYSFATAGGVFSNTITGVYQTTIRAAIARWAAVTNITFKEVADSPSVNIRIGWSKFTGTQIGETNYSSFSGIDKVQIFKNGTVLRLEDPSARPVGTGRSDLYQGTSVSVYQTALHEFGHALGLDHSTNPADIMYEALHENNTGLGSADIQGIQLLYGMPAGFAAPAVFTPPTPTTVSTPITPISVNLAPGVITVYRFFDTNSGTQFLTASNAERQNVLATRPDLTYEGVGMGGIAPGSDPNAVPVFRFFDTKTGTHFFTSSQSEQSDLLTTRPDLVLEQTSFYEHATAQTGDAPVYRFFDKTDGTHFYTSSGTERAAIVATRPDMALEGIAFYAPTAG